MKKIINVRFAEENRMEEKKNEKAVENRKEILEKVLELVQIADATQLNFTYHFLDSMITYGKK